MKIAKNEKIENLPIQEIKLIPDNEKIYESFPVIDDEYDPLYSF